MTAVSVISGTAFASFQDVGPKADNAAVPAPAGASPASPTTASTQAASPPPGAPTGPMALLGNPMILMLVMLVPVFLLSMRRNKKEQAIRASLKNGDRVVNDSGLIGELVGHGERISKVKLAAGVTVEMLTARLAPLDPVPAGADAKAAADKLKDLKDAKVASATGSVNGKN